MELNQNGCSQPGIRPINSSAIHIMMALQPKGQRGAGLENNVSYAVGHVKTLRRLIFPKLRFDLITVDVQKTAFARLKRVSSI